MKPEQAWRAALEQLQMEMPKATFDTWVRDTSFICFDDGVFTIGAANEYTRQWLEGRLSSTATRLLIGLMNQSVEVRFIVSKPDMSEEEAPLDEQGVSQTAEVEKNLKIQLVHASLRDEFVHPNRVIVIPGYFQRWLPYLGPTLAWIVVAFRQAMFMATHREARTDVDFEISPASVARAGPGLDGPHYGENWMIGCSAGLSSVPIEKRIHSVLSHLCRSHLGDAESLYEWLLAAGIRSDPIDVLAKSLAVEKGFIFQTRCHIPAKST